MSHVYNFRQKMARYMSCGIPVKPRRSRPVDLCFVFWLARLLGPPAATSLNAMPTWQHLALLEATLGAVRRRTSTCRLADRSVGVPTAVETRGETPIRGLGFYQGDGGPSILAIKLCVIRPSSRVIRCSSQVTLQMYACISGCKQRQWSARLDIAQSRPTF